MISRLSSIMLITSTLLVAQQYPFIRAPNSPAITDFLFEDSRGRIWTSSPDFLLCFDGSIFYPVPGLRGGKALAEDAEGGIWITSGGSLYRYYQGHTREIAKALGDATSVVAVEPTTVLVSVQPAAPGGDNEDAWLVRLQKKEHAWRMDRMMNMQSHGTMTTDSQGLLYFMCRKAWCDASIPDLKNWTPGTSVPLRRHLGEFAEFGAAKVLRDKQGCLWIRSERSLQYQCPNDAGFTTLPLEVATGNGTADLSETSDGSILVPSLSSVAVGRPGHFAIASAKNGLPEAAFSVEGKDGTIWISGHQGLYRFSNPFRMEYWSARDGLSNPGSIARIDHQTFAASGDGISELVADRRDWLAWKLPPKLGPIWHLLPTPKGTLLAVGPASIAEFQTAGHLLARSPLDSDNWGAHFARDADGQIWISGFGVDQVQRRLNTFTRTHENLPQPRQNGLDIEFEPKSRQLAACYAGGLVVRQPNGTWQNITSKEGLLENACRSLALHPNGDIWYGYNTTPAFALVRRPPSGRAIVQQFHETPDIGAATSLFLDVDNREWLWRGAPDGVHVADPASAEAGLWLHLDSADGQQDLTTNQQGFYSDADGCVWWAAENTITHFRPPSDFVKPRFSPQVVISGYSLNGGEPQLASDMNSFAHGSNIVAHVGSLQFDRRRSIRLRYRVLPEQQNWQDTRILNLPLGAQSWGKHTLEVQARLFTGPWSGVQRNSFEVLKPLWLSWPVLLAFAGLSFGAGTGAYRWRRKQLARARIAFPDLTQRRFSVLSPEANELTGTILESRFEVQQLLARGGFAAVFKGCDLLENCACAIKVFRQELVDKEWMARRFRHEVLALEQIHHPNVVRIIGHGTTPSAAPYLAMEFIQGRTVRDILETGALPRSVTGSYLKQAARALDQIHARGICHRDLKPENLMIRDTAPPDEDLVLIDFSIAIVKEPDETIHGLSRAAGTIHYMAPEQSIGYASPASDIYSLAKLIIEMLTGLRLNLLLPQASIDLPQRISELLTGSDFGLSDESIQLLSSALEFSPSSRPQDARAFANRIATDLLQA